MKTRVGLAILAVLIVVLSSGCSGITPTMGFGFQNARETANHTDVHFQDDDSDHWY